LTLVSVGLSLEIIGVAESFSDSLGYQITGSFATIPLQFARLSSLAFPILPYLSLVMIAGALLYGTIGPIQEASIENGHDELARPKRNSRIFGYAILAFALGIAAFLVWLPRPLQTLPIGGDTLYYISAINTMGREGPLWAVAYTDKPGFYLAIFGLQKATGLSTTSLFQVLPVVLAIGTTGSVWFLVDSFYREAAPFASLLTATSTALMRTSIDLYASFFATILFFVTLGIYLRFKENPRTRLVLGLQLMTVLLLASYWFVWALLVAVIGAAELASKERMKRVKPLIEIVLPSIAFLAALVVVAIEVPPPGYWGLG